MKLADVEAAFDWLCRAFSFVRRKMNPASRRRYD
jgi:hypothetical protein